MPDFARNVVFARKVASMGTGSSNVNPLGFLAGGGEMGEYTRGLDWSHTPLGPVESWPQSLRSALSICLNASFPIALYWGSDLVLLYNDDWKPIPGEKHPSALGRSAREVWPEIWETIGPLFEQVVTTGQATRRQDQLLPMRRHGFTEECYFDYTFSPIRGESGAVDGVFNAVVETTTRVVGERRLRTLRELAARTTEEAKSAEDACQTAARLLADHPHDLPFALFYLLGEDGCQAKLVGLTGVDRGAPISPATVDLDNRDGPWPFRQVAETGGAVEVHDLSQRFGPLPGGAWPEPSRRAVVLPMSKPGQPHLAGFVVAGISPRLAFDDDYKAFMALLGGHVGTAVANARAYEEERRRAEALAEIDRAKTAFFSNVSHEFRTPLTLMLGPIEDLLSGKAVESLSAIRERLELVDRNGRRLLRLVNTLLDFSRIEAGRVRAVYQPTDLAGYTAELASVFRSACERAGLRLVVDCPALSEQAFVDREMWEKIVLNLLSNAFKFTFEGEIAVALRQANGHAELRVRDSGTGIPQEEMPRLFERFHRVENSRGRTHEGSGIGLALVQELVKLHGGTVTAESELGQGTTFHVSIPLGSSHLPADQIGEDRASSASSSGAFVEEALRWIPGSAAPRRSSWEGDESLSSDADFATVAADGRPRIVLAEDNADMREYVVRLLSGPYDVEAVGDGEAALAAIRSQAPDLVLTDVMMPRLDGFGLLRELRADSRTSGLPVVMLSARAGEESRVEGMEAGADDYLVKPFSARELLARVGAHVQMSRLRRESERALRESEKHFRSMADTAPTILWVTDETGACTYLSRQWYEFTGTTPEQDLGFGWLDRVHPDDAVTARSVYLEANGARTPFHVEYRLKRRDGEYRWAVDAGLPRFDEAGSFQGYVGTVTDIHERRLATDELRRVAKELSDANRRKSEFLATLGHELRNPLAPIRTGLELMRVIGNDVETLAETRSTMERQAQHMARLIDDLLDVSRIDQGKLQLRKARVELSEVVRTAIETVRPAIDEAGHRLTVDLPAQPIFLDADPNRLAQVLSNLLSNSAKYTPDGGSIRIAAERQGSDVVVSVTDSGIGIPVEMQEGVFEMFSQIDRTLESGYRGLGIGLTLVKRLVEMHGGTVSLRSEGEGRGSEFSVRLPILVERPSAASRPGASDPTAKPAGLRVLVVDDNKDAAVLLSRVVRAMGNEVRVAYDGEEAVKVAAEFEPDVTLMDLGMPKMNGYEAARRFRQHAWGQKTILVALTGWGQDDDRQRTKDAGFDHHLVKPAEPAALQRLLETAKELSGA